MRSLSLSRGEQPYCGDSPVAVQLSMRLSWHSRKPGGTILTSDPDDLEALAAYAADVLIERI